MGVKNRTYIPAALGWLLVDVCVEGGVNWPCGSTGKRCFRHWPIVGWWPDGSPQIVSLGEEKDFNHESDASAIVDPNGRVFDRRGRTFPTVVEWGQCVGFDVARANKLRLVK